MHAHRPRRDRRVPEGCSRPRRRRQPRHPRGGHGPHHVALPRRLARRLPRRCARLDRSARFARRALASALPVVLRHHAGDVEAPRRDRPARARGQARPPRARLPPRPSGAPAALRPGRGHLRDLRHHLPRPRPHHRAVVRLPARTAADGRIRLPPRQGEDGRPLDAPPPASGLPPADVPGRAAIRVHRTRRDPPPLAEHGTLRHPPCADGPASRGGDRPPRAPGKTRRAPEAVSAG